MVGRDVSKYFARQAHAAGEAFFYLVRAVNGYLNDAPWFGVIKEDRQAAATTVYTALRAIDNLKVLLAPFLPFTCERLHTMLGYTGQLFGDQRIETLSWGYKKRVGIAQAIVIAVGLVIIRRAETVVAVVSDTVRVEVGLVRVGDRGAVVAGIAEAVGVLILLSRVGGIRTVVAGRADAVPVSVSLIRVVLVGAVRDLLHLGGKTQVTEPLFEQCDDLQVAEVE